MINISFDNPYLLLLSIPLFGVVIAAYCISIRKENRTKHIVASFIMHLFMVAFVTLSAASTIITATVTKTEVYVVADVSYSANANLDKVNEYIEEVEDSLPRNSKLGVVCFGRDQQLLTPLGEDLQDVKNARIDDSATDIVSALEYTSTLFSDETIKRIVIITDGKQTGVEDDSALVGAVEKLYAKNIYVDAMYLNDNITPDVKEVQISSASYMNSTYLNHDATAQVMLRTTYETPIVATLYRDGEKVQDLAQRLTVGFNVVTFDLYTATRGSYDYKVVVQADGDRHSINNAYSFTQTVSSDMQVLLVSSRAEDETLIKRLYGSKAKIESYINTPDEVPFTVEELCKYDEIILSNFDVRTLEHPTAFLDAVDTVTSTYGKSLLTFGNLYIQNQDDETLDQLNNMLPVNYGNAHQGSKLLSIVLDISLSMDSRGHLIMAKQAVVQLLELLEVDKDYVSLTYFADNVYPAYGVSLFTEDLKAQLIDEVESVTAKHGTAIEQGLQAGYDEMTPYRDTVDNMQLMLISDGLRFSGSDVDLPQLSNNYLARGIVTSTILTNSRDAGSGTEAEEAGRQLLKEIATQGNGEAYHAQTIETLDDLILSQIADDLTESVVENKLSQVVISRASDDCLNGLENANFSPVSGYVNSAAKGGSVTVLSCIYINKAGDPWEVPLYAYWRYGKGRVASFTSGLSNDWSATFRTETGERFLTNIFASNVPQEKVSTPYLLSMSFDGIHATVTLKPATIIPEAVATVQVTTPDGSTTEHTMNFYATEYTYKFSAAELGKYSLNISYTYANESFPSQWHFHASYLPEYDAFTTFDAADLYTALRNRGTVTEDGTIDLQNADGEASTYTIDCTIPFIIAAIALFVVDVAVRKLKWADIKSLFKRKKNDNGKGGPAA